MLYVSCDMVQGVDASYDQSSLSSEAAQQSATLNQSAILNCSRIEENDEALFSSGDESCDASMLAGEEQLQVEE